MMWVSPPCSRIWVLLVCTFGEVTGFRTLQLPVLTIPDDKSLDSVSVRALG